MNRLLAQYDYNVSKGPFYEGAAALDQEARPASAVRYIAYYLPQFHSIPENDEWWGAGFTEWTNVTKALPRYTGHYQPRLPADLGFYNLREVEVLRKQADMARRGGIYGFCIHNYWFSGRKVLDTPLRLLLDNPDIDLKFCLNWANESWSRRWDGSETDVLLAQNYAEGEDLQYADTLLEAFRDPRYIKVEGRPLLMVYRASAIPNVRNMVERWRRKFIAEGVGDPFIVMAQTFGDSDPRPIGMDAAAGFLPHNARGLRNRWRWLRLLDRRFSGQAYSYDDLVQAALSNFTADYTMFPCVCPQWDNEARKPTRGMSFYGSTPRKYGDWLRAASEQVMRANPPDAQIVFINAWNEWAEGTYLEPDRHFGYAYLAETARVLRSLGGTRQRQAEPAAVPASFRAQPSVSRYLLSVFKKRPTSWSARRPGK